MCGYFEAIWERIQNWKKENMSFFHMNTQTSCWILYITLEKSVYSQDFAAKANHSSQPKALSRLFKGLKRSLLSTHQRLSTLSLWLSVNSVKVNSIFVSQFVKNCRQVQRRLPIRYSITIIYTHFYKMVLHDLEESHYTSSVFLMVNVFDFLLMRSRPPITLIHYCLKAN